MTWAGSSKIDGNTDFTAIMADALGMKSNMIIGYKGRATWSRHPARRSGRPGGVRGTAALTGEQRHVEEMCTCRQGRAVPELTWFEAESSRRRKPA